MKRLILTYCLLISIFVIGGKLTANAMFAQLDSLEFAYDRSEAIATKADLLLKMATIKKQQGECDSAFYLMEKALAISDENTLSIRHESVYYDINRSLATVYGLLTLVTLSLVAAFIFVRQKNKHNRELKAKNKVIQAAMMEKDTLLREIHHRVKNNLQVISSLLSLQGRYTDDPSIEKALLEGKNRVKSMSLIHQNLYQKENLTGVDARDYFTKLFESLFRSYNIRPSQIKMELEISDLNLDVDTIVPIGLMVNEMVSNSLKYAFPNNKEGIVKIILLERNNKLHLVVQDDGIGIEDEKVLGESESFGYTLIQTFIDKLDADMTISSDKGTKIEMLIKNYKKVA